MKTEQEIKTRKEQIKKHFENHPFSYDDYKTQEIKGALNILDWVLTN